MLKAKWKGWEGNPRRRPGSISPWFLLHCRLFINFERENKSQQNSTKAISTYCMEERLNLPSTRGHVGLNIFRKTRSQKAVEGSTKCSKIWASITFSLTPKHINKWWLKSGYFFYFWFQAHMDIRQIILLYNIKQISKTISAKFHSNAFLSDVGIQGFEPNSRAWGPIEHMSLRMGHNKTKRRFAQTTAFRSYQCFGLLSLLLVCIAGKTKLLLRWTTTRTAVLSCQLPPQGERQ